MSGFDLIAFDMDGTLLDSTKQIRQDSLDMIKKAVEKGKVVCLSTGRCLPELEIFDSLLSDVHYFICISGALVYDNQKKESISFSSIPSKKVLQLFDRVENEDLMINYFSDKSVIEKDKIEKMSDYQMGSHQKTFRKVTFPVENIFDYYKKTTEEIYKINLYSKTVEQRENLFLKIKDLDLTFAYSEITSIECSAKGTSKASGLRALCKKLNISVERTIAVGDADNDLEILKTCGLPVAMGNANQKVKDIAKVVVKDNDNGGCAQAISEYLL